MFSQTKILTARRAYEFQPDDLRLTTFTLKPVQDAIQQSLHFQVAAIGTPLPTFGEVPATLPPGVVFNFGIWIADEALIPIRFLHIEQRRVVIDVAGPSSVLEPIFEHVRRVIAETPTGGGAATIGEPERVLDYSEITAKFSWPLDAIFPTRLKSLLTRASGAASQREMEMSPALSIRPHPANEEYPGVAVVADSRTLQLGVRQGTRPEDRVHFSAAPLDTEAHLAYLNELDAILAPK